MLDNCFLNLDIDFTNFDEPKLDVYISGDFIGEIQEGVKLYFKSKLYLSDEGRLKLTGEMNEIFVNAFNLNNMVNMTQMTLETSID